MAPQGCSIPTEPLRASFEATGHRCEPQPRTKARRSIRRAFSACSRTAPRFSTYKTPHRCSPIRRKRASSPASSRRSPGTPHRARGCCRGRSLALTASSRPGAALATPGCFSSVSHRFLSRDPLLIPRTSATATTNPYAFAANDPVNASDPSGLDPCIEYDRWNAWDLGGFSDDWNPPPSRTRFAKW